MSYYLMLAAGFAFLLIGGETIVRGAVATAERLGVSSLLIGVVVVGFGTSMPELVTSVEASLAGSPGIAVGNIVGSNISNILLVLGLSALIAPFAINAQAVNRDGVFVLAGTLMFIAIGLLMPLDLIAGIALVSALLVYLWLAYQQEANSSAKREADARGDNSTAHDGAVAFDTVHAPLPATGGQSIVARSSIAVPLGLTLLGLTILMVGGKLLVDGARGVALEAGLSETVVGLTLVAIGTSAPEMVTCVIAALRRHGDVALGNILGSSVYNLLAIGGLTAIISPTIIPVAIVNFDSLVMLAATLTMLIFLKLGTHIGRIQGAILIAGYVTYIVSIWPS